MAITAPIEEVDMYGFQCSKCSRVTPKLERVPSYCQESCLAYVVIALPTLCTLHLHSTHLIDTLLVIHALVTNISSLDISHCLGGFLCLPRRRANVWQSVGVFEDKLYLLESLASSLREEEGDVEQHDKIEDSKDHVHLPSDGLKCRGDERCQCRVERPVGRRCESDSFSADAQRIDLRRVDPRDWTPGGGVAGDEEVGASDEPLCCRAVNQHGLLRHVVNATGNDFSSAAHHACVCEHERHHQESADDEWPAAAPAVHPDQSRDGHDNVDDVLNRRGEKVGVARVACHAKDVGDVCSSMVSKLFLAIHRATHSTLTIHHHIHTSQLRPDLSEHADMCAVNVLWVEQLPVSDVRKLCFKRTCRFDIFQLVLNKGAVGITLAVDQSQDPVALFPPVFACEPARGLWHEDHEAEKEDSRQHLDAPSEFNCQLAVGSR